MIKPLLCAFSLLISYQAMAEQTAPSDPVLNQQSPEADPSAAQPSSALDLPDHYVGDLGLGAYKIDRNFADKKSVLVWKPYIYGDYGRFFGRLDTFGVKTLKLGDGYLEFSTRVNYDGRNAAHGLERRSDAIPLGIGTYQETSYGAFFLNGFYDAGHSHGNFAEAIYATQFNIGKAQFFPQFGLIHQSGNYNNYFYGVTSAESVTSGYHAYNAGASTNLQLGLSAEYPLNEHWVVNLTYRRTKLGDGIADSPIIHRNVEDQTFLALSYRFK
eukprot:gene23661-25168_t